MDEDVLAATFGFDEAEALGGVEPLYDARAGPGRLAALAFAAAKSAAAAPISTTEATAITPAAAAKAAPVAATAVTTAVTATAVTASVSAAAVATAITAAAAKAAAAARTSGLGGALRRHNDLRRRQLTRTSILFELVVDLVALVEAVEAGLIEGRNMNEDIGSAVVRLDETNPHSRVEPLDRTARHIVAIHRDREVSAGHMPAPG